MVRICEEGCWLECKWVASDVPSQAIVAMIHNAYNMYTNYSVHASHIPLACTCGTCPPQPITHHRSAQPLLWTALWALSLRGPPCLVQPRSRGWSWKGNWKPIQLWFFGTQNGARSRPENPCGLSGFTIFPLVLLPKYRRHVEMFGNPWRWNLWVCGTMGPEYVKQLGGNDPSLPPKLTTLGCIQTSYAMHF